MTTTADVFGYLARELEEANQALLDGVITPEVHQRLELAAMAAVSELRLVGQLPQAGGDG